MDNSKTPSGATPETTTGAEKSSATGTPKTESINAINKNIDSTGAIEAKLVSIDTEQAPPPIKH